MLTNDSHVLPIPSTTLRSNVIFANLSSARDIVGCGSIVGYTSAGCAGLGVGVTVGANVALGSGIAVLRNAIADTISGSLPAVPAAEVIYSRERDRPIPTQKIRSHKRFIPLSPNITDPGLDD